MRLLLILFWLLVAVASGPLLAISGVALYLSPNLPDVDTLRDVKLQTPLRVYSKDHKLIAEFGEMRRLPISFEQIPQGFIDAILAAEDDNFLNHHGVDPTSLVRAVSELITTGQPKTGGSTITMQVAKNFFLTNERVFSRKLNEILLALQIERQLSKKEIFELYVNKIYLGNRAYGIEAAAHVYYGKPIAELPLAELAMIAGLPKAPSAFNPIANPERARIRRDWILSRMLHLGRIDQHAYEQAIASRDSARNHGANPELEAPYVAEMVRQDMIDRFGDAAYTDGYHVYTTVDSQLQTQANRALRDGIIAYDQRHGYRGPEAEHPDAGPDQLQSLLRGIPAMGGLHPAIVSEVGEDTINIVLRNGNSASITWDDMRWARPYLSVNSMGPNPRKAADILKRGDVIRVLPLEEPGHYRLSQLPRVQSALISLAPQDGSIQALTGGFSFLQSNYNRVTQARRQPGSAFKPFLYSAALDHGYTPASLTNDAPLVFNDGHQAEDWRPRNSGGDFLGPIRLREALYRSRNLVSVRLMMDVGVDESLTYIERFGFNRSDLPRHLASSLGTPELTPLQMAVGYAVIANGGHAVQPWLIERIENSEQKVIEFTRPAVTPEALAAEQQRLDAYAGLGTEQVPPQAQTAEQVIDPRTIYQLNSMLQDVITRGTGSRARELQRNDLAGKTGTTNDQKDGWFAGYNGDLATVVWVGFDQPTPLGRREYGSTTALPIWNQFMAAALDGRPSHSQAQPDGMVSVRVDPYTGRTARPGTPGALIEIFKEEDMPPSYNELEIGGYSSDDALTPLELF